MQSFAQLEVYRRRRDAALFWGPLLILIALGILLTSLPAWAQAAAAAAPADPTTQQLLELLKFTKGALGAGEFFAAAIAAIIALVFAVRIFGKKVHDFIPDDSVLDKPFFFLFDTKPGGVILNALVTSGVVLAPALLSGAKMTPVLAGSTLLAGVGASAIWGWLKDLIGWWKARKPDPAPAQAAGVEASKAPGPNING
jgi:hypothetical protein